MRAFIALPIPLNIRMALAALQQDLAQARADVKWVAPEHLHVTLKFLDEITEAQGRAVTEWLTRLAREQAPFTFGLNQLGAFPSLGDPRVLWVGLGEGKDTVRRWAEAIEREARAGGLTPEERPFAAHVTLGRARSSKGRSSLVARLTQAAWSPPTAWLIDAVTLYRSVLTSAGPQYTALAHVPLIGA